MDVENQVAYLKKYLESQKAELRRSPDSAELLEEVKKTTELIEHLSSKTR